MYNLLDIFKFDLNILWLPVSILPILLWVIGILYFCKLSLVPLRPEALAVVLVKCER